MDRMFQNDRFFVEHLLLPMLWFSLCVAWLYVTRLDLVVADHVYAWSGYQWSWRDRWLTAGLIHQDGRKLVGIMLLGLVALLAASYRVAVWRRYRIGLWYLLLTALLSGVVVNVMKELTHLPCPWDWQRYGGNLAYASVYERFSSAAHSDACFPAGHASAGYAWLGLYYVCRRYWPRWRFQALAAVLTLGLVFGIGQQLRGAHFLSHDLWSLAICWVIATVFQFMLWKRREEENLRLA